MYNSAIMASLGYYGGGQGWPRQQVYFSGGRLQMALLKIQGSRGKPIRFITELYCTLERKNKRTWVERTKKNTYWR
jgi:hypothetical protein